MLCQESEGFDQIEPNSSGPLHSTSAACGFGLKADQALKPAKQNKRKPSQVILNTRNLCTPRAQNKQLQERETRLKVPGKLNPMGPPAMLYNIAQGLLQGAQVSYSPKVSHPTSSTTTRFGLVVQSQGCTVRLYSHGVVQSRCTVRKDGWM